MYPGWGWVGTWRGYTGTPSTVPGPIFSIFLRLRAYPRPNEGKSEDIYEVSQIDLRIDPQIDPELTQI